MPSSFPISSPLSCLRCSFPLPQVSANGNPISPDLAIWRFSPTAYLHVGVRISGAVLATGITLTGLYGAMGSCDVPSAIFAMKAAVPALVPVAKAAVAAPLAYHWLGGVRQMYHDFTGEGLTHEFQVRLLNHHLNYINRSRSISRSTIICL